MAITEGYSLALFAGEDTRSQLDVANIVHTHAALLFRVAYSVVRNRQEAEDVVQDTFVRVLLHRSKLPAIQDLRVWLVRIAWNLALDHRRRIRPDQLDYTFAASLTGTDLPADQAIDQVQRTQAVLTEMERLPKAERNVLLLSAINEMTIQEVAQVLKKSESATRALIFRARTRLKERVAKGESKR